MLKIIIAGRLGKDAQHRTTQTGTDICSFTVACDVGWGENKSTQWVDVAKFGKGAEGLSRYLKKGDPVTVTGDLTTREHEGKTYLNCRADDVALQGGKSSGGGQASGGGQSQSSGQSQQGGGWDDLDDKIPFDPR